MNKMYAKLATLLIATAFVGGCRPYMVPKYADIQANETAFVVPLEGANLSLQGKFGSVEYLEKQKVAAKRIQIGQRWNQTGRIYFDGEWLPTERVIKVSRSPVTVHWAANVADGKRAGTGIWVESIESIGFGLSVNITACVAESDTATYLYNFPEQGLEKVINETVRSALVSDLSTAFGSMTVDQARVFKGAVFNEAKKVVLLRFQGTRNLTEEQKKLFAPENNPLTVTYIVRVPEMNKTTGITVYKESERTATLPFKPLLMADLQGDHPGLGIKVIELGLEGGLTYESRELQKKIDEQFISENSVVIQQNDFNRHEISRRDTLADAVNERQKAEEIAKASKAYETIRSLDIAKSLSEKWNGSLPSFLILGGTDKMPQMLLPLAQNVVKAEDKTP